MASIAGQKRVDAIAKKWAQALKKAGAKAGVKKMAYYGPVAVPKVKFGKQTKWALGNAMAKGGGHAPVGDEDTFSEDDLSWYDSDDSFIDDRYANSDEESTDVQDEDSEDTVEYNRPPSAYKKAAKKTNIKPGDIKKPAAEKGAKKAAKKTNKIAPQAGYKLPFVAPVPPPKKAPPAPAKKAPVILPKKAPGKAPPPAAKQKFWTNVDTSKPKNCKQGTIPVKGYCVSGKCRKRPAKK